MKNPRQKKFFVMIGSVLLAFTTELVVLGYYWGALSGWWRVLTIGLFFVAYVQLWASWWYVEEGEDRRVITTAYVVSCGLALIMAFNAAMILITRTEAKTRLEVEERSEKTLASRKDQDHRAEIARIQAEADAINAAPNWRIAREARLEKEAKERREAEAKRRQEQQAAAAPLPASETVAIAENDLQGFIDFAKWYCRIFVFFVPIVSAIIGKYSLGFAISLPGGAEPGQPTSHQRPELTNSNPPPPDRKPVSDRMKELNAAGRSGSPNS